MVHSATEAVRIVAAIEGLPESDVLQVVRSFFDVMDGQYSGDMTIEEAVMYLASELRNE